MNNTARDLIAGGCAGMASTTAMYPMDTARTRLQMFGSNGRYTGVLSCLSETVRQEGFRALYKGLSFPFAAQLVFKSVIFSTNGFAKREMAKRGIADSKATTFICGAFSGTTNAFLVAPVELVRTKLMLQFGRVGSGTLRGPVDCVQHIVHRHGVLGMWQGLKATVARDAAGVGMFFTANAQAKAALMRALYGPGDDRTPNLGVQLLSGSAAGTSYWAVALPLDTAKTVIQGTERRVGASVPGLVSTIVRLVREGGIRRLYSGWPAALGRGVPGAAIIFTTHAQVSQALESRLSPAAATPVDIKHTTAAAAALSGPAGMMKRS